MKCVCVLLLAVMLVTATPVMAKPHYPLIETVVDVGMVLPKAFLAASFGAAVGQEESGALGAVVFGIVGLLAGARHGLADVVVAESR